MKHNDYETLLVELYKDSTGLFSEEECNQNNWWAVEMPTWLVKKWYEKNETVFKEQTAYELKKDINDCTFEDWFFKVYILDDMDGIWDFAKENGFKYKEGYGLVMN